MIRLSPQFQAVMNPLGANVLLAPLMQEAMRCCRENRDLICAQVDVFIKQPPTDWKLTSMKVNYARLDEDSAPEMENFQPVQWYPEHKTKAVRKKLSGVNPVSIIM